MRDVVLRRGLVDETGVRHRRAAIRPLTGREEERLVDGRFGARRASELLAACTVRLGGYHDVSPDLVALLSRGDRWRLALTLRDVMCGDQLVLTITCPNPGCRELADLELRIGNLLGEEADPPAPEAEEITVETPEGVVRLRPPLGLDDEAVDDAIVAGGSASGHHAGRDARSALLWSRLVLDVDGRGPCDPDGWAAFGAEPRQLVAGALAEMDSILDLTFASSCPSCGAWIEIELDPFELLSRELGLGASRLLAEVHSLAFHYGWSEDAVLDLPRARRWAYLELLRNQLEDRPLVDLWS